MCVFFMCVFYGVKYVVQCDGLIMCSQSMCFLLILIKKMYLIFAVESQSCCNQ